MRRALTFLAWPLLIVPQVILWTGALLNQLAIVANGGAMPVQWYAGNEWTPDPMHIVMVPATHLKVLCDWINLHSAILSPGDVLLNLGELITGPAFWAWIAYVLYRAFQAEVMY